MHSMTIALGLTLVAFPALANAPADIADLVGARAAGAARCCLQHGRRRGIAGVPVLR